MAIAKRTTTMRQLQLYITKQSEGFSYGHSDESVKKFESLLEKIQNFFNENEAKIKSYYKNIIGIRVSNSGCNVWLVIEAPDRSGVPGRQNDMIWHQHLIRTTQNEHLIKFGFEPRKTDLERFLN